jgi:hypothetical protein
MRRRRLAPAALAVAIAGAFAQGVPASAAVVASKSTHIERKPVIPRQHGKPPTRLVRQDIIVGTGRAARDGDDLRVKYVLKVWPGGAIPPKRDAGVHCRRGVRQAASRRRVAGPGASTLSAAGTILIVAGVTPIGSPSA